jgi:Tol biopolymer transport system component
MTNKRVLIGISHLFILATLAACGGGGGGGGGSPPTPGPGPGSGTPLTGKLIGPVGAQVVLQNNGGDDLTATVMQSAGSTARYDQTTFTFATPQLDGTPYLLSVMTPPIGQTCAVFAGASGSMPMVANSVWVGCEHTYDHLVRSTDDSVIGGYSGSQAPMLGGSSVPIGSTAAAYGEGRFAVFTSSVAGIGGASGAQRQVFWRDRGTGETLLVSATASGAEGNGFSYLPVISADGLTVAFESVASNLVTSDTNAVSDVFVWSATNPGAGVQRVSVGAGGIQANAASFKPSLSGDGRVVAFESGATNLTATSTSGIGVFRRDLTAGTNTHVSRTAAGQAHEGGNPVLSEDGNRLAFSTYWPLLASDANSLWDIYVYDHTTAGLARVSLTSTGGERLQGNESASRSVAPAISGDGRYVAYATTSPNVVPGDTNVWQDVFVVDTQTGGVVRASVSSTGAQGNGDSPVGQGERMGLSYDGKWVAFTTKANNLGTGAGGSNVTNVLLRNWETGETRALTDLTTSGADGPVSMTRTGAYAAFWAGVPLDSRFNASGLFARYTGLVRAFAWVEN